MPFVNATRSLEDESDWWPSDTNPTIFLIWIGGLFCLLVCPFMANRQMRNLCCRRFIECNWNLDGEDATMSIIPHMSMIRSYPVGDPRHVYTKEEADNQTKTFLLEKLTSFTKKINATDFIDDDVEMGQNGFFPSEQTFDTEDSEGTIVEKDHDKCETLQTLEEKKTTSAKNQSDGTCMIEPIRYLKLPGPGISSRSLDSNFISSKIGLEEKKMRCISAECAICLTSYSVGDQVTWSTLTCNHAFHQECIVGWLMVLGKKANRNDEGNDNNTIMHCRLNNFAMFCPVCRQDFISPKSR